jgi:hypothetical protein
MVKNLLTVSVIAVIAGYFYFASRGTQFDFGATKKEPFQFADQALAARFDYLSKNGNSSCSASFRNSIFSMSEDARLQGSCCSPMSMHRYSEQVEGLKKYSNIPEIPTDPYDIEAGLAKKLMGFYDMGLTLEEQKHYDYAMQNSSEKGPCCCKCWRWYVYGGLGKLLIKN